MCRKCEIADAEEGRFQCTVDQSTGTSINGYGARKVAQADVPSPFRRLWLERVIDNIILTGSKQIISTLFDHRSR